MAEWKNVTNHFTEEERHYRGTYLEICEVMDDEIEVSWFSSDDDNEPGQIYMSFGIMYGISYVSNADAEAQRDEMKREIAEEHEQNNEPSSDFINSFAAKYKLTIENSLFNETELMESLLNMF